MAICKKCKKDVGCGCQLVNGLCPACRPIPATQPPKVKPDNTK